MYFYLGKMKDTVREESIQMFYKKEKDIEILLTEAEAVFL